MAERKGILLDLNNAVLFELFSGSISYLPDILHGDNTIDMMLGIDALIYDIYYIIENIIEAKNINDNSYKTYNFDDLHKVLNDFNIPYIDDEKDTVKKQRASEWNKYDYGGGTEETIKYLIYRTLGSGIFIPYDGGNTDPTQTSRIDLLYPTSNIRWGDFYTNLYFVKWGDYNSNVYYGNWADLNTIGVNDFTINVKFGNIIDFWENNSINTHVILSKLIAINKPIGLNFNLKFSYDGTPSPKIWINNDRNDITDLVNYSFIQSYGNPNTPLSGINNCLSFDGNSYLSYQYDKTIFSSGTSSVSIFMFLKPTGSEIETIVEMDNSGTLLHIYSNDGFSNTIFAKLGNGNSLNVLSGTNINDGNWHSLAVVTSGTFYNTYLDNLLVSSLDATFSGIMESGTLYIGSRFDGTQKYNGMIDELMIFDYSLSASDIDILHSGITLLK